MTDTTITLVDGTHGGDLLAAYAEAKAAADKAAKAEAAAKAALQAAIGEATEVVYNGATVATWRGEERSSLDIARVKAEAPEVYAAFQRVQTVKKWLWKGL